ncbi:type II secretion system F family protein [Pelotomaculum propionicicum]|uniref:type II secretion system F family protein n=1 Tax=Pelotomaculum propionicicum TaxID=258475 RepID=UPI003B762ED3
MLIVFALSLFGFVMLLAIGIIKKSKSSPLVELLNRDNREDKPEIKVYFLDSLWDIKPQMRSKSLQQGLIASAVAFIAGLMFAPQASLIFAVIAFVIAPRAVNTLEENTRKRSFFKSFPHAIAEVAAVARTQTMLDGFKVVAKEHRPPVSEVFGYIAEAVENGSKLHTAVMEAHKQYQYPGLDKLSDAVRIIEELGGGERSAEVLNSAADHIRFLERFRGKVDAAVGGIVKEIGLATAIVVGYFIITSGPGTEGWDSVKNHVGIVMVGFAAIGAGWYFSLKKIQDFKNKSYM